MKNINKAANHLMGLIVIPLLCLGIFCLGLQEVKAADTYFQFDHDCASYPPVCALPIGSLEFTASTPVSVPPSSSVPVTFSGTAIEALGETPICPVMSYGGNGLGSMGVQVPVVGISGNCYSKGGFDALNTTSFPLYFTAPATPGTYSFCANGQMNNAAYMQISGGAQCDTYTVSALPTGTVEVTTNNASATWTITGPATLSGTGLSATYNSQPTGTYTITWGGIAGYTTPASTSFTLTAGGTLTFPQGNYVPVAAPAVNLNFI